MALNSRVASGLDDLTPTQGALCEIGSAVDDLVAWMASERHLHRPGQLCVQFAHPIHHDATVHQLLQDGAQDA